MSAEREKHYKEVIIDTLSINCFIKYSGCMVSFTSENYVFSGSKMVVVYTHSRRKQFHFGGPNVIYTAIAVIFAACMSLKGKILWFLCL